MAAQRIAESWRYLWGKTGKSATLGKVVDYGFTTSEGMKKYQKIDMLYLNIQISVQQVKENTY